MQKVINVSGEKISIIKDLAKIDNKAFVYLDPPYYPVAKTKDGKVSPYKLYNNDYKPVDFLKLKLRCDELTIAGIPFVLSNSNCEFIRTLFKDYPIIDINELRVMKQGNGKGSRPAESCLLITNFKKKKYFMDSIKELNNLKKK